MLKMTYVMSVLVGLWIKNKTKPQLDLQGQLKGVYFTPKFQIQIKSINGRIMKLLFCRETE